MFPYILFFINACANSSAMAFANSGFVLRTVMLIMSVLGTAVTVRLPLNASTVNDDGTLISWFCFKLFKTSF